MRVITQKPKGFQPFSILVETPNEANLLASLVGSCDGFVTSTFCVDDTAFNRFYSELSKQADCEIALNVNI